MSGTENTIAIDTPVNFDCQGFLKSQSYLLFNLVGNQYPTWQITPQLKGAILCILLTVL